MNISNLRLVIKDLKSIIHPVGGKEYMFSQAIKLKLPETKFELIGEELCINRNEIVGKCDLWLANCPNNFLVSLELKVGELENIKKQQLLVKQVYKYSYLMSLYYPEYIIYGLGAYKYHDRDGIRFIESIQDNMHVLEIRQLKSIISKC